MSVKNLRRASRAPVVIDVNNPSAMGVCDGCGFWQNHKNLLRQMEYRGGSAPVWTGFLVCAKCFDVPNQAPQFRRQVLPPDPVPILNPRPEQQTNSGFGYWVTETGDYVTTLPGDDPWGNEFVVTIPNQGYG